MITGSNYGLGWIASTQGDLHAARSYYEACLAGAEQVDQERLVASTLNCLGEVARDERDWATARDYYERALVVARRLEFHECLNSILSNLGAVAWECGDLSAAYTYYQGALTSGQVVGSKDGIAHALDGLGAVAARRGAWSRAGRLAGAADALREAIGYTQDPNDRAFRDRYVAEIREAVGEAGLASTSAEGRGMTLEQATGYALEDER
jgi:tetratricopeptide (TPR) repeat protein